MIKYRSARNLEMLQNVTFKLQKRIDKFDSVNDTFDKIDEFGGDTITLGTKSNNKALIASSAIPAAPLAIGVGALVVGLVILVPAAFGVDPSMSQAQIDAVAQMEQAGGSVLNFAGDAFGVGIKLLGIPATVAAISIPKKIARILADKYNLKNEPIIIEAEKLVEMINDVINEKEDPSLEIPRKILTKVDLRENSEKFNMDLLKHLAYYRQCYLDEQAGKNKGDELEQAFQELIDFLEDSLHRHIGVSKKYKDNPVIIEMVENFYQEKVDETRFNFTSGLHSI